MQVSLRARWVLPVDGPPIENGAVTIEAERITAIGSAPASGSEVVELAEQLQTNCDVAILPGLVNAHTHLEFSDLPQPLGAQGMPFADWIAAVVQQRRAAQSGPLNDLPPIRRAAIARGYRECTSTGATTIGDIASFDPPGAYDEVAASFVVFREWLGLGEQRAQEVRGEAAALCDGWNGSCAHAVLGISPHAPYSTHVAVTEALCDVSRQQRLPLAMHLAESRDELALLASHQGRFRRLLEEFGIWNAAAIPHASRPLDFLQRLARAHRALVIHGNYLRDDEIEFLAEHRDTMSAVYCPRTHEYFQHEPYPLGNMLAAGVNVALGTDSRASNPDLNLLDEMRTLARLHPTISPDLILHMATAGGAAALGMSGQSGSLKVGRRADLVVIALPDGDATGELEQLVRGEARVVAVYQNGQRL